MHFVAKIIVSCTLSLPPRQQLESVMMIFFAGGLEGSAAYVCFQLTRTIICAYLSPITSILTGWIRACLFDELLV